MERADWLETECSPEDARLLMVTAIIHHRIGSRLWSEDEIRKLRAELAEIDAAGLAPERRIDLEPSRLRLQVRTRRGIGDEPSPATNERAREQVLGNRTGTPQRPRRERRQ